MTWTRRLLALLLGAALGLAGCQSGVLRPLSWGIIPSYNAVPAPDLLTVEPKGLIVGDSAPFDGFLVATEDWRTLVHEYLRLQEALTISQTGRGGDRASCDDYVSNLQGEVTRLKEDRPRICALCAAGASTVAGVLTGAAVVQACD